jgi:uncharacterized protein (TIGR04168 family)
MRLAIVGDVHGCWVEADCEYFNRGQYDALLCTGDLPPLIGSLPTARKLAALHLPAYMIPGNHDATGPFQFLAELRHRDRLAAWLSFGQGWRENRLRRALGSVQLVGYSLDLLPWQERSLGLITARPYSMGGDRLYFRAYLQRRHGITSFDDSTSTLRALVDQAPADVIFFSHNGPAGLGAARDDIWGCDFRSEGGDFGDPDLRVAIDYALRCGKRVHAVIAGHMHHRLKAGGGERKCWQLTRDGVLYLNAARVPRIRRRAPGQPRHHIALTLNAGGARAEVVWIDSRNEICQPSP